MITERKRRIIEALRGALDYCGYDLDTVIDKKSRARIYSDLRSIIWTIYQSETNQSFERISQDFHWDRVTIFCAVERAKTFRQVDPNFADMYDSVYGAYLNQCSVIQEGATVSS